MIIDEYAGLQAGGMKWDGKSGYLQPEDVQLITHLAGLLPKGRPITVVDLGAGSGTTALAALTGANRRDARLISVDINPDCLKATEANMAQYGFLEQWGRWQGRSNEAPMALGLNLASVDMLLCDATHDYASQQDELMAWFPFLVDGAYIWVHDYHGYANSIYPGVKRAVDEFIAKGLLETVEVAGWSWGGRFRRE